MGDSEHVEIGFDSARQKLFAQVRRILQKWFFFRKKVLAQNVCGHAISVKNTLQSTHFLAQSLKMFYIYAILFERKCFFG